MKTVAKILLLILTISLFSINVFSFNSIEKVSFPATVTIKADFNPPRVYHTGIDTICVLGEPVVFNITAVDDKKIEWVKLFYKKSKESTFAGTGKNDFTVIKFENLTKKGNKFLSGEKSISSNELSAFSKELGEEFYIYYYFEAYDGYNKGYWWGKDEKTYDENNPKRIEVKRTFEQKAGPNGARIILPDGNPDDGYTFLDIPKGALDDLVTIRISQVWPPERISYENRVSLSRNPICAYSFEPEDIEFKKPVTTGLLYFDYDRKKGIVDNTDYNEKDLKLFWYDGFEWRVVGGTINIDSNVITGKVTHLGLFGLFPAKALSASAYKPKEHIITPCTIDNQNDFARFDGLAGGNTTIRIFDITGKKIKTIDKEPYQWDGTDDSGDKVESGVYIYQFRADVEGKTKLISGTIIVAK